jgi:hypothetical protein
MENMDYKNMDTKELLQMISEQVSKEEINEGDKLIIQNVLKELFEKKCSKKYVKVTYYKIKRNTDRYVCPTGNCGGCLCGNCDDDDHTKHPLIKCECKNQPKISHRSLICRIVMSSWGFFSPSRRTIAENVIERFNDNKYYIEDMGITRICIQKIEDIEL